jgi:hypothetical protein
LVSDLYISISAGAELPDITSLFLNTLEAQGLTVTLTNQLFGLSVFCALLVPR